MRYGRIALLLFITSASSTSWGVPAAPIEVTLTHSDTGEEFLAIPRGDEHANWMETADGYTIVQSHGVWFYATQNPAGALIASQSRVGSLSAQQRAALTPHLRPPAASSEEHFPVPLSVDGARSTRSVRTQPLLTVLVDFNNISFQYSDASFQSRVYGASASVRHFFLENSYGNLSVVPAQETYGTANDGVVHIQMGTNHPNGGSAWQSVARSYVNATDPYVNYAAYDTDSDGIVAAHELSIMIILAGYENSFGGSSSLQPRVWGHKSSMSPSLTLDGKSLAPYTMFGERMATSLANQRQSTLGIFCHELGHLMLGLPDLYDTDGSSSGIGNWCLMAGGGWNYTSLLGDTPSHLSAWCKDILGMTVPFDLYGTVTDVSLASAGASASMKRIWLDPYRSPRSEFFLLENRQPDGYDSALPGDGMLIWHIDGTRGGNANEARKRVDLEEADGFDDLDVGYSGDIGDPYPGYFENTIFNAASYPDSLNNSGQNLGVAVTGISDSGPTMTFDVVAPVQTGESIFYNELGRSNNYGYNSSTCWTALRVTNSTSQTQLDGFEVFIIGPTATVDFYLYENMVSATPTTLLYSQTGIAASNGWSRIMLNTPQPFPPGSDRVMVMKIVDFSTGHPAGTDASGINSGRSFLDSNGLGAFDALPVDLAQTALLSGAQLNTVYVNFSYQGQENGTSTAPFDSFGEALTFVTDGGTIVLNGAVADTASSWTGTISQPVTITAGPSGAVRIGESGAES